MGVYLENGCLRCYIEVMFLYFRVLCHWYFKWFMKFKVPFFFFFFAKKQCVCQSSKAIKLLYQIELTIFSPEQDSSAQESYCFPIQDILKLSVDETLAPGTVPQPPKDLQVCHWIHPPLCSTILRKSFLCCTQPHDPHLFPFYPLLHMKVRARTYEDLFLVNVMVFHITE